MRIFGKRFRRSLAGVTLVALAGTGVQVSAETLTDALIDAYRNSNLLEQNRAVLRAADDDVAIAFSNMLPTLDFITDWGGTHPNPAIGRNPSTGATLYNDNLAATFQLQASIAIYTGGRNRLGVEAQKETVLATREALRSIEQRVLVGAVTAYMGVLRAEAFVDLRENNVRVLTQEKQATQDRFDVGEVTRTDVAQAESRLAAAISLLEAARGDLEIARETYKSAVGRYPGNLANPPSLPQTAGSLQEAANVGVRTHPDIREAQREVNAAELAIKIAHGAYLPTVSATVTSQTNTNDLDVDSHRLGVRLSQPIYRGGSLAALERKSISQRDAARSNLLQTTLLVEENVGRAWANLQVAGAQIRAIELQINAAQIAFDGTREEARLGARTTLDVLDAEQELLDARADRIDAIATQHVAAYSLLASMGLMTVDHLNLGIQTYDPAGYYTQVRIPPARLSPQGKKLDQLLRKLGKN